MNVERLIDTLVDDLKPVPGVVAIVLGGSRARGTHTLQSDVDLALYYRPDHPLDVAKLRHLATVVDDTHRPDLLTDIGGWGPWINGGGWLTVQTTPVDLLYRDLHQVATVVGDSAAGHLHIVYQPGHPHGFSTAIYLAEIALCQVLWDPTGAVAELKRTALPYPAALRVALIQQFFWEAEFSLKVAAKAVTRRDISYIAGCCFRSVSCLLQTLFALNECYWMNEKGAVAIASSFPHTPQRFSERVDEVFQLLAPTEAGVVLPIEQLGRLVAETSQLLFSAGVMY